MLISQDAVALWLRLYAQCPVGCVHCCISAVPGRPTPVLPVESFQHLLVSFSELVPVHYLGFAGPEIYIGDETLLALGNFAALELGWRVAILTSGYWGLTDDGLVDGIDYLRHAAVSSVQLSFDVFHFSKDKRRRLGTIARELRLAGFQVTVRETVDSGAAPEWRELGVEVDSYVVEEVAHVGRAMQLGSASTLTSNPSEVPTQGCDFGDLVYMESDLYLYHCSGAGCRRPARAIGAVNRDGLPRIFPRRLDGLRSLLYPRQGPKSALQRAGADIRWPRGSNPCSACARLFDEEQLISKLLGTPPGS